MKTLALITMVTMGIAATGCCGAQTKSETPEKSSTEKSSTERVALLNGAKVEADAAIKAALAKAPGRVVDLELRSKSGKTVWEVDVLGADGKVIEVDVDASSGAVTDSE